MNMKKLSKADQFAEDIMRVRNLAFPRLGMRIEVNGQMGTIAGMNNAGNLDVLFTDQDKMGKRPLNCHPTWETAYFDADGNVIADYRKKPAQVAA